MRAAGIRRELARNIVTGTSRTVVLATIAIVVAAAAVIADVGALRQLLDEAEEYRSSGAATLTLLAPGRVDGATCAALANVDGVHAAGALRASTAPLHTSALPGAPLAGFEVTTGLPAVLSILEPLPSGVIVSRDVAETLGLRKGEPLATLSGEATVAGVFDYPSDGRRPGFGWAALLHVDDRRAFDECWVQAWPQQPELRPLLLATLTPAPAGAEPDPPLLAQLNATHGWEFAGAERFGERITAYAPLVASAFAAALAVTAVRARRLELASNLHAGARRRDLLALMLGEAASWAVPAALLAAALALLLAAPAPASDRAALAVQGLKTALGLLGATGLGTVAATVLVHERHLFAYFKDRR